MCLPSQQPQTKASGRVSSSNNKYLGLITATDRASARMMHGNGFPVLSADLIGIEHFMLTTFTTFGWRHLGVDAVALQTLKLIQDLQTHPNHQHQRPSGPQ
ncbi:hypothetical protein SeMB42_g05995 [Synchytrium endobioticum]|uniref:Uncharacterized protein n=1 Tax=Synchytrium endobioticum TaxID=286115 RepID=A0A507CKX1_9FUNG|nr:hypothetical protein SeMB42_g05995 [Synchytrium endobioticum]